MQGDCLCFHVSSRAFNGRFEDFYKTIEPQVAREGIAKLKPPKDWTPSRDYSVYDDFPIRKPVWQSISGDQRGLYKVTHMERKGMKVRDFRAQALQRGCKVKEAEGSVEYYKSVEEVYWKSVSYAETLYGADVSGSFFDSGKVDEADGDGRPAPLKVWLPAHLAC